MTGDADVHRRLERIYREAGLSGLAAKERAEVAAPERSAVVTPR